MYDDNQSIKAFERMHARERLAEEERHVGEQDDAQLLVSHLAGERAAQRLMSMPICLGPVILGISHEINNLVGITVHRGNTGKSPTYTGSLMIHRTKAERHGGRACGFHAGTIVEHSLVRQHSNIG